MPDNSINSRPEKERKAGLAAFLVPFALMGMGCYAAYWVVNDLYMGLSSLNWEQVDGMCIRTWLEESSSKGGLQWTARVQYRYRVHGMEYQSDRVRYPERRDSPKDYVEKELQRKYKVGSTCTVFYNPQEPAQACLEPGPNYFFMCLFSAFSLIFIVAGVVWIYGLGTTQIQPATVLGNLKSADETKLMRWPFFYGLQARWFGPDRLFKVFFLRDSICGARVAGQITDEQSAHLQILRPAGVFGLLFIPWIRRVVRRRAERERYYDAMTPGSTEFLAADGYNFLIHQAECQRIVLKRRSTRWTGATANSGSIEISLVGGACRRFILVGQQDVSAIAERLANSLKVDIEVR